MTMGFRIVVVFSLVAPLLLGLAASSGQTAQAEPEPRYDSATTVDLMTVVADLREVPRGSPLSGSHLIVRPESAKENSETIDVYLGPADFLKDFEVAFGKGDFKILQEVRRTKINVDGLGILFGRFRPDNQMRPTERAPTGDLPQVGDNRHQVNRCGRIVARFRLRLGRLARRGCEPQKQGGHQGKDNNNSEPHGHASFSAKHKGRLRSEER